MALIKLLRIEDGDSQKNLTDKLNYNFNRLISFGGGPYGRMGKKGPVGPKGPSGPVGSYGDSGNRGTLWTVGVCQPSASSSVDGDYWLDTNSDNLVYQFSSNSGWSYYGFNIKSTDLFDTFGPLTTLNGTSAYSGYFISSQTPINYTVVVSDADLSSGSATGPNPFVNPQYSKFVIATDSQNTSRNLLEFSKGDYADDINFTSRTPRMVWNTGPTSDRGPYGLMWKNDYLNINLRSVGSSNGYFNIKSNIGKFSINSTGFNYFSNDPNQIANLISYSNIDFDLGTGKALFSTKNILWNVDRFYINSSIYISTSTTEAEYALDLVSSDPNSGNLRYIYGSNGVSDAVLMDFYQNSPSYYKLFTVTGDGVTYADKVVRSVQTPQSLTQSGSSSTPIGTVNWVSIVPSLTSTGYVDGCFYVNNGSDYIIGKSPSASVGDRGISIFTPATGGYLNNENGGWLNILDNYESITFTLRSDTPGATGSCFKYIGLNTDYSEQTSPSVLGSQGDAILGGYAANVEITIINMTGSGGTNSSNRWFRVYYSAWGGTLTTPQCGVISTYNSIAN